MSKFRLKALRFRHVIKDGANLKSSTQYRQGDVIELSDEEAKRLLDAGAIEPVASEQEAEKIEPSPDEQLQARTPVREATAKPPQEEPKPPRTKG